MRRREFFKGLAGAALVLPLAAHAQERTRRVAVLVTTPLGDPETQARIKAFLQGMQELGWTEGRNIRFDIRWDTSTVDGARKVTAELIALSPDVILAAGVTGLAALQTRHDIPIVFTIAPDPVGAGFVDSLAQPGGNVTGFMQFEYSLSAKWLELLKEIAPSVTRAAVLRDPTVSAGVGQFAVIQAVAPGIGIDVRPINLREATEIERGVMAFARTADGGLIVTASPWATSHRELIARLATTNKLPSVGANRLFAESGGLVSYGANFEDQFRRAANYVDRILKGAKPADLPVQAPTKYELVVNVRTAKALGLPIPPAVLARADQVIE
ncbi:MAG: ABC transporter substrate-binding protein [Pseudolabrys sp.]